MERFRERVASGLDFDVAAQELRDEGLTIVAAMKQLMSAYGIGLGEVKSRVSAHPAWQDVVSAAQPLHDDLESLASTNESDASG